jgi:hypothetical protein
MSEICRLSATELANLIAHRQLSLVEVVNAHLARIDAVNPALNTVVGVLADEARIAAESADQRLAAGARAFLDDLKERMRKFELALHPDKTRLIHFGRHAAKQREKLGEWKPETFDFLGFTHFCTRSRKWGRSSSGARRLRSGCEPACWRSRSSCAG